MKRTQVKGIYREYWSRIPYQLVNWQEWDYSHLKKIMWERPAGRGQKKPFNDIIIGIDTETSKTSCPQSAGTLRSESEIRGTLRFQPQLEMRPSSNAPSPVAESSLLRRLERGREIGR